MEFSIYRLDYISSVYIHTHVGLVSAVPGALVSTRPCEDRAYYILNGNRLYFIYRFTVILTTVVLHYLRSP